MIEFIADKKDFENYKKRFLNLFHENKEFEDNIFKEEFKYYIAFDFDFIYEKFFFERIKIFLKKIREDNIIFFSIEPSSENYFYKYFEKYGVFSIRTDNSYDDLYDILYKDLEEKSGKYIGIISNEISLFSPSNNDWAMVASRSLEIAIVGFSKLEIKNMFIDSFDKSNIFCTIKDYIEMLNMSLHFNQKQLVYYQKILANYNY